MATIRYQERFNKNYFEHSAWAENALVCGIDEVGRGCLAGPVVVAAVILHHKKNHRLIKDSKIMTVEEREKAFLGSSTIAGMALLRCIIALLINTIFIMQH